MKIIIILDIGAHYHTQYLNFLVKKKHHLLVVYNYKNIPPERSYETNEKRDFNFVNLYKLGISNTLNLMIHFNPDIVIQYGYNYINSDILVLLFKFRTHIPIVFGGDSNGHYLSMDVDFISFLKLILKKMIIGIYFNIFSGFFSLGSANTIFYEFMKCNPKKIHTAPFYTLPDQIGFSVHHPNLSSSKIVTLGRLVIQKNMSIFPEIAKMLKEKGLHFCCEIYGEGPEKENIYKKINDYGVSDCCILKGKIRSDDVANILRIADVFVLASYMEPWGIVLMEAMYQGIPVVASNRIGAGLSLINHGENGFLVEWNSPEAYVREILNLLSDKDTYAAISKNGKETIQQYYIHSSAYRLWLEAICAIRKKDSVEDKW